MRSKVTVVLLFLNVLLFYYIFEKEGPKVHVDSKRVFPGSEIAAIDTLVRTVSNDPVDAKKPAGGKVKLILRGESWWLTEPYEWPANPNAVSRMLNELKFLEHETSFAVADLVKSGQSLTDYGLDHPALTLTFISAGKEFVTKIGDDTKIGNRLYLLSPDGTRIHVVGRSLVDSIGMPIDALRAESIFTIPVFEVRSLNVQTAAPSNLKVRLRRDSTAHWAFETPILARANKGAVEVTINALNALSAKKFLEASGTDLDRVGLNSPSLRVTLEGNARRETLLIGNPVAAPAPAGTAGKNTLPTEGFEYYAKIEDKAVVFTMPVPQPLLEVLRSAQETLRDPHVLDFEPRTVTALTLNAPGQPELSLQRLEGGTGTAAWQIVQRIAGQAPQTIIADTALVEELLQKIYLLSALKVREDVPQFVSDGPSSADIEAWGFNRPEREITLSLNTGGGPSGSDPLVIALQIGVSPDKPGIAFARTTNLPFVYQIAPDILEATPVVARHYRQRLLRPLPEGAKIQGISLTETATGAVVYAKQLDETQNNWDLAVAGESEARRRAIGMTLSQLHTLRAKRFTADSFNPDHADTPQGPRPWKYRLDLNLSFAGGNGTAQSQTSTLFLTERLGGNTQLAGTGEFGGAVFELSQELVDSLFTLIYRDKNDPGAPAAVTPAPAAATAPVTDAAAAPVPAKTAPPPKP